MESLLDESGEAIEEPLVTPGLIIKYSTHKNLASIDMLKGNKKQAMHHYLDVSRINIYLYEYDLLCYKNIHSWMWVKKVKKKKTKSINSRLFKLLYYLNCDIGLIM